MPAFGDFLGDQFLYWQTVVVIGLLFGEYGSLPCPLSCV